MPFSSQLKILQFHVVKSCYFAYKTYCVLDLPVAVAVAVAVAVVRSLLKSLRYHDGEGGKNVS